MITVIIEGTKNIRNTLTSLQANSEGKFRVYVENSVRSQLSKTYDIEFVKPGLLRRYGKKSDFYWVLPSGCLILCSAWDKRIKLCKRPTWRSYCLYPGMQDRHYITNRQSNVKKWKGVRYRVPILSVTEA